MLVVLIILAVGVMLMAVQLRRGGMNSRPPAMAQGERLVACHDCESGATGVCSCCGSCYCPQHGGAFPFTGSRGGGGPLCSRCFDKDRPALIWQGIAGLVGG